MRPDVCTWWYHTFCQQVGLLDLSAIGPFERIVMSCEADASCYRTRCSCAMDQDAPTGCRPSKSRTGPGPSGPPSAGELGGGAVRISRRRRQRLSMPLLMTFTTLVFLMTTTEMSCSDRRSPLPLRSPLHLPSLRDPLLH